MSRAVDTLLHVVADTSEDSSAGNSDVVQAPNRFRWVIPLGAVLFVVVGAISLAVIPAQLLNHWIPGLTRDEQGKLLGTAAQIVLFGLGGIIAVVGVSLSLARHGHEVRAADRDRRRLEHEQQKEASRRGEVDEQKTASLERDLRARFVTAVDLLSSEHAIKRTASLYALGALADDWDNHGRRDEVQVCAEVICSYLRSPLPGRRADTDREEVAVRQAGYSVVRVRLAGEQGHSWSNLVLDLRRARVDFVASLQNAQITGGGQLLLQGAVISSNGTLEVFGLKVSGNGFVSFEGATVSDTARLRLFSPKVRDTGIIDLGNMLITEGGRLDVGRLDIADSGHFLANKLRIAEGGWVGASEIHASGYSCVELNDISMIDKSSVALDQMRLSGSGGVMVGAAHLSDDAVISVRDAHLTDEASLNLAGASLEDRAKLFVGGAHTEHDSTVVVDGVKVAEGATFVPPVAT